MSNRVKNHDHDFNSETDESFAFHIVIYAQCISREYFRADARAVRSWIKEEGCATFTILKQLNYLNST